MTLDRCLSLNTPPALEVSGLSKSFDNKTLFSELSFCVNSGGSLCITGPSGSGKSVLLRCLNSLIKPDSGEVFVDDTSTSFLEPSEVRRRICLVGQKPVIFTGTVLDNLEYPFGFRANRDLLRPDFGELIGSVGLSADILSKDASLLSGGEQQRVAIARALALSPSVLLLDEPTSALDPDSALLVEELVMDLNRKGVTLVLVTHDSDQADRICDQHLYFGPEGCEVV